MARMRRSWYLQRQLEEAQARENYFRNRERPVGAYRPRPNRVTAYYRSLFVKNGNDHVLFKVDGAESGFAIFGDGNAGITALGLLATLPADTTALNVRGSGMKPSKISFYKGDSSPARETTAWNTRYTRYYRQDTTGAQVSWNLPIGSTTATPTVSDVQTRFNALFATPELTAARLGDNGAARLILEKFPISVNN